MLESDKQSAELYHWAFAHEWWKGLGLELSGVEIGDVLEYDVLATLGRAYFMGTNDGQPETIPAS